MVLFQVHLVDKGKREKKDTLDPKEKKVHLNMLLLALGTLRDQTNESINPAIPPGTQTALFIIYRNSVKVS